MHYLWNLKINTEYLKDDIQHKGTTHTLDKVHYVSEYCKIPGQTKAIHS